jgi:hypothetical protein
MFQKKISSPSSGSKDEWSNAQETSVVYKGYVDWIGLAQDRNRWRTLVNSVLNLQVP